MKLKITLLRAALMICFIGYTNTNLFAQCFQIESILVDACGTQEGLNEMVRFKVGNAPINTSNLNVDWPNNPWQGLVQNAATASKVASLNADILDAGGCGQLVEPTAGVLPANATVILVTSFNLDTALNSFGALTQTLYILFQNNPATASGHFANSGNGLRTLSVSFGGCSDTVTYDRALLVDTTGANVAADGAIVQFNPAGTPTYINNGCSAPVPPFTVDAGPAAINVCAGSTLSLSGIAQGQQTVAWTASNGSFSNPNLLDTNYNVPSIAGNVLLTLTATNSCGATVTDQILLTVGSSSIPNFATTLNLCTGATAPILNTTSPNGITGTWNPATINNTASGNYTFTPNPNQCATSVTLQVSVTSSIIPNFATTLNLCTGATAPILNTTSPNGITGTWNPATINNMASGNYIFTPNSNQCATSVTLQVSVANSIIPNFATTLNLCTGATPPILNATSLNGITGTWNPATISNSMGGTYTFTPNGGQCAAAVVLTVTVEELKFQTNSYCQNGNYIIEVIPDDHIADVVNYEWRISGTVVGHDAALNVTELIDAATVYPISFALTLSVPNGCSTETGISVYGTLCSIPKGISPNGDAKNDDFDLTGLGVKRLQIYNRYGTKVYEQNNYSNQWNGQSDHGQDLPDATYYYAIELSDGSTRTGWVYLNR